MEQSIIDLIIQNVAKQGFSFIILGGVVYYFHRELERIKAQFNACNKEIKDLYARHSDEMKEVLMRNTEAFERNNEIYLELKRKLHD